MERVMSASAARETARQVVSRVRERTAYARETMDALLVDASLDDRDKAFASRLAFGTIACRGTLDEALQVHLKGAVENLVLDALATSAYELLFMRTPPRAAVSEGVELVRSVQPKAAGLANAVLRRLAERAPEFPWGDPESDDSALARLHGHPEWLAKLLIGEIGRSAAAAVMEADNEPAPLFLGLMPFKQSDDATIDAVASAGGEPESTPLEHCIVARKASAVVGSEVMRDGFAVVADAGAQLAAAAVPLHDGARIAELGAGRGTKTLLLAARARRLEVSVDVIAVDLHGFKLEQLTEAAARTGAPGITTLVADATDALAQGMPSAGSLDAVLVDAPCSGLGTLRRHPDRRWKARPEEMETLAELGGRLLRSAAILVKPGGFVVYSTCTIARRENDSVVDDFLASPEGEAFSNDDLSSVVPNDWRRFATDSERFQSLPEPGGPDGHYIARLVRKA